MKLASRAIDGLPVSSQAGLFGSGWSWADWASALGTAVIVLAGAGLLAVRIRRDMV